MRVVVGKGQRFCRWRGAAARGGSAVGLPAAPHHVPGDEDGAG